jgi:hypothetical protein
MIGGPLVATQDSMLDLVQGEMEISNLIGHAFKKTAAFLNRRLKAQLNDSVNHAGIVNVDPECKLLISALKGSEIERPKAACETPILFKFRRGMNGFVTDDSSIGINESSFHFCQHQG